MPFCIVMGFMSAAGALTEVGFGSCATAEAASTPIPPARRTPERKRRLESLRGLLRFPRPRFSGAICVQGRVGSVDAAWSNIADDMWSLLAIPGESRAAPLRIYGDALWMPRMGLMM